MNWISISSMNVKAQKVSSWIDDEICGIQRTKHELDAKPWAIVCVPSNLPHEKNV